LQVGRRQLSGSGQLAFDDELGHWSLSSTGRGP
jgi:hypothetical protein